MTPNQGLTRREALQVGAVSVLGGLTLPAMVSAQNPAKPLKVGIIGLDTSHVVAFTKILNNPKNEGDLAGIQVVAAFPGGSQDIPSSKNRLEGFTKQLRETYKVEIVDSIPDLLKKVDAVLLESVDGRPHLAQATPVIEAGKPIFIDKPVAGSLADAIKIYNLAKAKKVPVFSSSSLRFAPDIQGAKDNPKLGEVIGCDAFGACELEEHHPDLYWYGIHGVEALFTIMGTGCVSVTRTHTKDTDFVTGTWKDGRIGTYRGIRKGKKDIGAVVFGSKDVLMAKSASYEPLVVEIAKFFKSGKPPVSAEETLEIFAFMEAADESKRKDGTPVLLSSVLEKGSKG
ncbi:MAG: Gfo/Idh/MocA family oxidoreductase [Gemmataceae bacterium]|nr:Gfo/Idh/MocA family oxidoreductase [Gemmataceae bacterium]